MPLLSVARFMATLLSLAILAAAAVLVWTWREGYVVEDPTGALVRVRDDWRIWAGVALLGWSFLGRRPVTWLIASPDQHVTSAARGAGRMMPSPTGSLLYVEDQGPADAPAIIFTHGWGLDSTFWSYAKRDLIAHRGVFWDLPGLGRSIAGGRNGVSLSAFALDLATVIEAAGAERPVLVGHSIGGMTIQTLLRDNPQIQTQLAGVVLLNTTYTNPLKTMILSRLALALRWPVLEPLMRLMIPLQPLVWLAQWQSYLSGSAHIGQRLGFGAHVTRSQLEHATLLATRNPPGALARGNLAMFAWDSEEALSQLQVPALIIGGDKDIVTKLAASRHMAGESPLTRLEVIAGGNHMGPMEQAEVYNAMIASFAAEVQPRAVSCRPASTPDGATRVGERHASAPAPLPPS